MPELLASFLVGSWVSTSGSAQPLHNPATEEILAEVGQSGDLGAALAYGRRVGGSALRALSFAQRAHLLASIAKLMHEHRDELIATAVANGGNTRGDAKFDIDGATAVLASYAELGQQLGETKLVLDGPAAPLLRTSKLRAQHVLSPRRGIAIHINAFNFPAWGMVGKLAVALLAGVPVLSKPATSSALLAHRIAKLILDAKLLPEGAFQLLMGPAGDLLDHVGPQDLIAFTGSADTGARIRGHAAVVRHNVKVNLEADSLNAAVLGPDVAPGSELFDLVVRDCSTELTQKAGQKCTANRRILVPSERLAEFRDALFDRLGTIAAKVGNPANADVRMGPLATRQQLRDAHAGVATLRQHAKLVRGDLERTQFIDAEPGRGYFLEPLVLEASAEAALDETSSFHHVEVFGPVVTLLPYDGRAATAAKVVALGGGSLIASVYSDDRSFVSDALHEVAPFVGRLVVCDEKNAGASLSPGAVLPVVNHGGPGRAGGGGELGGRPGLEFYLQRTTVQGGASQLARLLDTKDGSEAAKS